MRSAIPTSSPRAREGESGGATAPSRRAVLPLSGERQVQVARLYAETDFAARVAEQFEGD
jgi:hypothetical protein